jgi:3'(2'), 5'-bisphosphate nucleotidase
VIAVPVRGTCYYAVGGGGARLRHADGGSVSIRSRSRPRAQVSVLRSRARRHPGVDQLIGRLGPARVVSAGSSLKACLVAQGLADLYLSLGSTSEWDTAAAQCLVEEAGGGLTDFQLEALRYNTRSSVENPPFLAFGDPAMDWRAVLTG